MSVFSFLDCKISKCQWFITGLVACLYIVEICFAIVNGRISLVLPELSAHDMSVFSFLDCKISKCQWFITGPVACLYIVEVCFAIVNGRISLVLPESSLLPT